MDSTHDLFSSQNNLQKKVHQRGMCLSTPLHSLVTCLVAPSLFTKILKSLMGFFRVPLKLYANHHCYSYTFLNMYYGFSKGKGGSRGWVIPRANYVAFIIHPTPNIDYFIFFSHLPGNNLILHGTLSVSTCSLRSSK